MAAESLWTAGAGPHWQDSADASSEPASAAAFLCQPSRHRWEYRLVRLYVRSRTGNGSGKVTRWVILHFTLKGKPKNQALP